LTRKKLSLYKIVKNLSSVGVPNGTPVLSVKRVMNKITVILGHYGSGKTQIAVNYALYLANSSKKVNLADLDIVNPYFRTSDSSDILASHGIRLIVSDYANSGLDVPSMPPAAQAAFDNPEMYSVLDVGGDDRGALALGRYSDKLKAANIWLVINRFRPLTATAHDTVVIMREIETAANVKVNGLINNSNLGAETTAKDIISSDKYAEEVSAASGLPIVMTTVCGRLYDEVSQIVKSPFRLEIFSKKAWKL
jgi:energy-coupling factor transporter ATP-binding protein EcfA2